MDSAVVIGVDMGTTNIKAVAYDQSGNGRAESSIEVGISAPGAGRAEQDPAEILDALVEAVREVTAALATERINVAALSFGSAMHSIMAVDSAGAPLTPCVTWADNRAIEQVEKLRAEADTDLIYARTGTPVHPMSPLAKLLWFKSEERETFEKAARWISIKEYALARMTGEFVVDHSIASATGLFSLIDLDWDPQVLELVGLAAARLSSPVPTTHAVKLNGEFAGRLGMQSGTPLIVGASDGALGNLGLGVLDPGVVACSIGTSGAVRTTLTEPKVDPSGRLFCYVLGEGHYILGGSTNSGGLVLKWVRDRLFPDVKQRAQEMGRNPYDLLDDMAEGVPPGAEGLVFLPYLAGERAPLWRMGLTGGFYGLTINHGREHMVRAVFEGVIYHLYTVVQALAQTIGELTEFRAAGGFAYSDVWPQIMADVFGANINIPARRESACWGAALLGFKAIGMIDSIDVARDTIEIERVCEPVGSRREVYAQSFMAFGDLFKQMDFPT